MKRPSAETLYYALSFALRMPTWVVMAVYLVRTLHLSPLQLVLMGTAMEGAVFLFEVPTGVVSVIPQRCLMCKLKRSSLRINSRGGAVPPQMTRMG